MLSFVGLLRISGVTIVAAALLLGACSPRSDAPSLSGAGASFPGPVYRAWATAYRASMQHEIRYEEVGSSEGINRIKAGEVDFGASDMPLDARELELHGLVQVPALIGGVAIILNLPGIKSGDLVLSGQVLADMFLGEIRNWNDAAIKQLNPDKRLPARPITIVHRSDGSGTTWLFTRYLSRVSSKWQSGPGTDDRVAWPLGQEALRNAGVLRKVMEVPGALGYVEYTFAREAGIPCASLLNGSGKPVTPSMQSFYAAVSAVPENEQNRMPLDLLDRPGESSWPITGATYFLLRERDKGSPRTRSTVRFLTWCYDEGGEIALRLHYIPLPDPWAESSIRILRSRLLQQS